MKIWLCVTDQHGQEYIHPVGSGDVNHAIIAAPDEASSTEVLEAWSNGHLTRIGAGVVTWITREVLE